MNSVRSLSPPYTRSLMWVMFKISSFQRAPFLAPQIKMLPLKLGVKQTRELKPVFIMKIDFSARFYFAQLFILFAALSIIFIVHKWVLIHWW